MKASVPSPKTKAGFIPPMLLLRTERPPEGANWLYGLNRWLPGAGHKTDGRVQLRSRNDKDFNARYPGLR